METMDVSGITVAVLFFDLGGSAWRVHFVKIHVAIRA